MGHWVFNEGLKYLKIVFKVNGTKLLFDFDPKLFGFYLLFFVLRLHKGRAETFYISFLYMEGFARTRSSSKVRSRKLKIYQSYIEKSLCLDSFDFYKNIFRF